MSKYKINLSGKIQRWKIDNLSFDELSESLLEESKENFKYLDINIDGLLAYNPPANASLETKSELLKVKSFMEHYNDDYFISYLPEMDKDPIKFITDYFKEISKKPIDNEVKKVLSSRDAEKLALKLKIHYSRPRPFQIADYYNIDFNYNKSIQSGTGNTPSYPSGHTLTAYFAAHVLSHSFPEFKNKLLARAKMVALSRIKEGVHFPSDNKFSIYLSEKILLPAYIRYINLSKADGR